MLVSETPRMLHTSPAARASTSRKRTTCRWASGMARSASSITTRVSSRSMISSGFSNPQGEGGVSHIPLAPIPGSRSWSSSSAGESESWPGVEDIPCSARERRSSRTAWRRAWLARMPNIQERSEERPSKPSMPRITASHVSWTASSTTDSVRQNERANRVKGPWRSPTSSRKAASSPDRNFSRKSLSCAGMVPSVSSRATQQFHEPSAAIRPCVERLRHGRRPARRSVACPD